MRRKRRSLGRPECANPSRSAGAKPHGYLLPRISGGVSISLAQMMAMGLQFLAGHRVCFGKDGHYASAALQSPKEGVVDGFGAMWREEVEDHIDPQVLLTLVDRVPTDCTLLSQRAAEARV
eukprot:scaffold230278_cov35-Tisochrysis_lutea.AAC.2